MPLPGRLVRAQGPRYDPSAIGQLVRARLQHQISDLFRAVNSVLIIPFVQLDFKTRGGDIPHPHRGLPRVAQAGRTGDDDRLRVLALQRDRRPGQGVRLVDRHPAHFPPAGAAAAAPTSPVVAFLVVTATRRLR